MGFWVRNPSTGKEDTMLSAAIAGFIFSTVVVAASFVASWVTKNTTYLSNVASIIGAIIVPTVGAYTARRYMDTRSNGNDPEPSKNIQPESK